MRRAERSLQERQAAVGKGVLCRVLWLTLFALFHQYRLEQLETGGSPVPIPWLLVPALALAVWTWRLNWRYIQEGGERRALLESDLLAMACAFALPYLLAWVPGGWEILLGLLAAVVCMVKSVKTLRIHYGLPWGKRP